MEYQTNSQLELAYDYVRGTSTSIFLTGKAGSGKTTFLQQIKGQELKRMVVVAPTGVAAINAGGMTIHSFFQLPLGVYLPDGKRPEEARRVNRQKLSLMRSLELLVIDEISMVRADLLDAIDDALRRVRADQRPFGGVQLLMIGDLHQLPPVVKPEDWNLLKRCYTTPYFFGSLALQKSSYVTIELKSIYRQNDADFIGLLNQVRDNRLDTPALQTLNSRYVPNFRPGPKEAYITLTATNAAAHEINTRRLAELTSKSTFFSARIEGEFPASSYPTEEKLEFKPGAQVMFIRNDLSQAKRYFNGKLGRIVRITEEAIHVLCEGDSREIEVVPAEWQNVKFAFDETTKEIREQVLGTFIQYPLKLAWAITIHKSQGLTFERAIVDAQAAFAHGQVYVALSRCRSFAGIVLSSRLEFSSVKTDPVVMQFSAEAERNAPTESQIQQAKRQYQQQLVQSLFDFQSIHAHFSRLRHSYAEHQSSLIPEAGEQVAALARQAHEALTSIADKFQPQLLAYLQHENLPEENSDLKARLAKAATYFVDQLSGLIKETQTISTTCDNQAVQQFVTSQLELLQQALFVKQATFAACHQGFSTLAIQRAQANAAIDFANSKSRTSPDDLRVPKGVPHPELYRQLLEYRRRRAEEVGIVPREVLTNESLRQLVHVRPTSPSSIRRIHGIGKKRFERYGADIQLLVRAYCEANQVPVDEAAPVTAVSNTKVISFEMFQAGQSMDEIAQARKLTVATIEGHLAHFVAAKQLDVLRILPQEKLADIEPFFVNNPTAALSEAKQHFGDKYSYGQIKLVLSHLQRDESEKET